MQTVSSVFKPIGEEPLLGQKAKNPGEIKSVYTHSSFHPSAPLPPSLSLSLSLSFSLALSQWWNVDGAECMLAAPHDIYGLLFGDGFLSRKKGFTPLKDLTITTSTCILQDPSVPGKLIPPTVSSGSEQEYLSRSLCVRSADPCSHKDVINLEKLLS
ncbi:hypothetical protein E1301_Tti001541 [Triplophysa tibetana]|uniref:Uncharacterized protein n=1 Tax=Triplophysa tibetana TaxID=1572043 RepID=A0A5A9P881_9TELE|nr:hypothetical protein E1301_Tti001541 [Triplophysa tibetana]